MPRRKRTETGRGRLVALVSATTFLAGLSAGGLTVWSLAPQLVPPPERMLGPLRHLGGVFGEPPPPETAASASPAVLLLGTLPEDGPPPAPATTTLAVTAEPRDAARPDAAPPQADRRMGETAAPPSDATTVAQDGPELAALAPSSAPGEARTVAGDAPAPRDDRATEPASGPAKAPAMEGTSAPDEKTGDSGPPAAAGDAPGQVVVVRRGDTLLDILTRVGVPTSEAHEVVTSLRGHYDPRHLKIGQALQIGLDEAGRAQGAVRLASLSLNLDFASDLRLRRDESGTFTAETVERELVRETAYARGAIDGSLYAAARAEGVPADTLQEVIKLLSWDVDFQRDIHPGDRFELLYDRLSLGEGGEARGDGVRFAALVLNGRSIEAYRYQRRDGSVDFYDSEGRPLRKWLMRTPIDGARLSSTFGPRRHPVLGYTRMHKGTDFAAPTGTPIYAAGDGVVEFAGRNKGYGNYVRIRHNDTYSTAYAHMSRFAKGIKRGQRVRQGEVIGHVGATGLATGPHLHYEVLKSGTQVNPQTIENVVADPLDGPELKRFLAAKASVDAARHGGGERLVAGRD